MIFAPVIVLAGFLSLAGALAVAPNAELLPRSPCYTRTGPIRCRTSPGTSYPTVRVLGDNKWFNPKCKGRGESVGGNRVWIYLGDKEDCWVSAEDMTPHCPDSLRQC
ncbi:hypothetical protein B0H63DRAFT_476604 [Podospora didyma]|uniref:Uncharacterized protein n=1 Tax=Podospora didyma TaxID=330526 RepID=A0AAE0NHS9_9PEZI|nr:hypothetical protein B0H63DRAFT_476604 [Podospora didyma]